jgi:nicotinate-nucleotide adenylyltransferase
MKIAIYSGSFNPVHNGHMAIATKVIEQAGVDELWFLISPQNPLKKDWLLMPENDRLAMVKLAIEDEPKMKASDFEFHLPRPTFTITTLDSLKSNFPQHDFILLVGGDNLSLIQRWYQYKRIVDDYGLIVYPRPGYSIENFMNLPNVQIINAPFLLISATEIRSKIKNDESIEDLVPPKVAEYIHEKIKDSDFFL